MKGAHLSSPSVAYRHLQKLEEMGLLAKNDYGEYVVKQKVNLNGCFWLGRHLIPKVRFYWVIFLGIFVTELAVLGLHYEVETYEFKILFLLMLLVTGFAMVLFIREDFIQRRKSKQAILKTSSRADLAAVLLGERVVLWGELNCTFSYPLIVTSMNSAKTARLLKFTILILMFLLVASSASVAFGQCSLPQSATTPNQNSSTSAATELENHDTLIMQLYTALQLAQSRLGMALPNGSQYLTTTPDANQATNQTKVFLVSTEAWYHYSPAYPFTTSWVNDTNGGSFSSMRDFDLTDNRSVALSFWGWGFGSSGNYEFEVRTGDPYLMIGITLRNDYTPADFATNGGSGAATIKLNAVLYAANGTVILATKAPDIQSPTATGDSSFLLKSNETKQVVFYLVPSSLNIDHYAVYVSSISSVSSSGQDTKPASPTPSPSDPSSSALPSLSPSFLPAVPATPEQQFSILPSQVIYPVVVAAVVAIVALLSIVIKWRIDSSCINW
jgi:hypothetical protein